MYPCQSFVTHIGSGASTAEHEPVVTGVRDNGHDPTAGIKMGMSTAVNVEAFDYVPALVPGHTNGILVITANLSVNGHLKRELGEGMQSRDHAQIGLKRPATPLNPCLPSLGNQACNIQLTTFEAEGGTATNRGTEPTLSAPGRTDAGKGITAASADGARAGLTRTGAAQCMQTRPVWNRL